MRPRPRHAAAAIGLWLALPIAASAQTAADTQKVLDETEYIKALTVRQKARNDQVAGAVAPLTGLAGTGKAELGEGGGEIESWLLTADTLDAAAGLIVDRLKGARTKLIVLAGDETLDFTPLFAARIQVARLQKQVSDADAAAPRCPAGRDPAAAPAGPRDPARLANMPMLAALGAVGSVLQSDIKVSGVEVKATPRLLASAVAARIGEAAVIPSALTLPPKSGSGLQDEIGLADRDYARAVAHSACLDKERRKDAATDWLAEAVTTYATMSKALTGSADGKEAPLVTALKLEWLAKDDPSLVRVYVDRAGGSVVTRKNIWTMFGAPAVAVSGGLVASFTQTSPQTGRTIAAGLVSCRTRLASLRDVQRPHATDTAPCRAIERKEQSR